MTEQVTEHQGVMESAVQILPGASKEPYGDFDPSQAIVEHRAYYDQVSASGKRYRVIERDGKTLWEYEPKPGKNPAIYDPERKKLVAGAAKAFTSQNAADMQALGQEAIKRDVLDGARQAIAKQQGIDLRKVTDTRVRQAIGEALVNRIVDKDSKDGVSAAKLYMEQQEMMPKKQQGEQLPPGTVRLSITADLHTLRKALANRYQGNVVDGEVKDAE